MNLQRPGLHHTVNTPRNSLPRRPAATRMRADEWYQPSEYFHSMRAVREGPPGVRLPDVAPRQAPPPLPTTRGYVAKQKALRSKWALRDSVDGHGHWHQRPSEGHRSSPISMDAVDHVTEANSEGSDPVRLEAECAQLESRLAELEQLQRPATGQRQRPLAGRRLGGVVTQRHLLAMLSDRNPYAGSVFANVDYTAT